MGSKTNPLIVLLALLLTAGLVGSFAAWLNADASLLQNTERRIFIWLLVCSEVFLLITRAMREWTDRR